MTFQGLRMFLNRFHFQQPTFLQLEAIGLLIENKPQVLIFWKVDFARKIIIKPLGGVSRRATGAQLLLVPDLNPNLTVVASSFWRRRTKRTIALSYTSLDAQTDSTLLKRIGNMASAGKLAGEPLHNIRIQTYVPQPVARLCEVKNVRVVPKDFITPVLARVYILHNAKPHLNADFLKYEYQL